MTKAARSTLKPDPSLARVRNAVRGFFRVEEHAVFLRTSRLSVAVSGGADSLALAEACAYFARQQDIQIRALVVDHGLQAGSAQVAQEAAATALSLGVDTAEVISVEVRGTGGPEAMARSTRYAALTEAVDKDELVLLGHTRDDQAETVLLGLGRGSGPRSIAGMRPLDSRWARPLLDISRADTRQACVALGIHPWQDPHNTDPRFTRVRLRSEVMPLLEEVLSGGVAAALARTAAQLREDCDALDSMAEHLATRVLTSSSGEGPEVLSLVATPVSLRRRVLRQWLLAGGVPELTDSHLRAVDALIGQWHGQGGVWLPGGFLVGRSRGRLVLTEPDDAKSE